MFEINGETWHLVFVSPGHSHLTRSDGTVTVGVCDNITKTIYLDRTLDKSSARKVLAHEITHAAMFSYNIKLCTCQEEKNLSNCSERSNASRHYPVCSDGSRH
jgi:hypothetical protein